MLTFGDGDTGDHPSNPVTDATSVPTAMVAPKDRERLDAHLTPGAHAAWFALAERHDTTVTALLEVLGRRLAEGRPAIINDALIAEAQEIKKAHRSRKPHSD